MGLTRRRFCDIMATKKGGAEMRSVKEAKIDEFAARFPDEDACWEHLFRVRFPEGFVCPKCGDTREPYHVSGRRTRQCKSCSAQISLISGTIMEKTMMPLRKWFYAFRLVAEDKRGCSAVRLQNELSLSYSSAWYMLKRIQKAMGDRDKRYELQGIIEIDEFFIAGDGARNGAGAAPPKTR